MIGEGPAARSVKLDLPPFTLVGATTRAGMLTNPLRDRFGIVARLEFYTAAELTKIVTRSAGLLKIDIDPDGALEIARRSRGTPRIVNRLLAAGARLRGSARATARSRARSPMTRWRCSTSTHRGSTSWTGSFCARCSTSSPAVPSAWKISPPRSAKNATRSRTCSSPTSSSRDSCSARRAAGWPPRYRIPALRAHSVRAGRRS